MLLCAHCDAQEDERVSVEVDELPIDPAPGRRTPPSRSLLASVASALAGALLVAAVAAPSSTPDVAASTLIADDDIEVTPAAASVRLEAYESPPRHALAMVEEDGEAIELIWYHPIAGTRELPEKSTRRFGAARDGDRPAECGEGHCGVDLGGQIGTIVHAARPGQVERIVDDPSGRGGRYVKLRHDHDVVSYYMHLDEIAPNLVPGIELAAGDPLGTLGSSGIHHSAAHLHFQVAFGKPGEKEHFVDPEPMLRQAILLDEAAPWPTN